MGAKRNRRFRFVSAGAATAVVLVAAFVDVRGLSTRSTSTIGRNGGVVHSGEIRFGPDAGKRQGPYVQHHPNGRVFCEGRHERGDRVGLWTFYDTDGRITWQARYRAGERAVKRRSPPWWRDGDE